MSLTAEQTDPIVPQEFILDFYTPLPSLPTHLCTETNERYLLWSDIQNAFKGIVQLKERCNETLILFTVDSYGELYSPGFQGRWVECCLRSVVDSKPAHSQLRYLQWI